MWLDYLGCFHRNTRQEFWRKTLLTLINKCSALIKHQPNLPSASFKTFESIQQINTELWNFANNLLLSTHGCAVSPLASVGKRPPDLKCCLSLTVVFSWCLHRPFGSRQRFGNNKTSGTCLSCQLSPCNGVPKHQNKGGNAGTRGPQLPLFPTPIATISWIFLLALRSNSEKDEKVK